MPYYWNN